jgi:hypothetical protein
MQYELTKTFQVANKMTLDPSKLAGIRLGKLRIVAMTQGKKKHSRGFAYLCDCDCGTSGIKFRASYLLTPKFHHCGCTPFATKTETYKRWLAMKARCKPTASGAKNYYERGIKVCDLWANSYSRFYEDMGECPLGWTLDRINNDKGYSADNCRWITRKEQNNNTRANVFIFYRGDVLTIAELADRYGIPYRYLHWWHFTKNLSINEVRKKYASKLAEQTTL